MTHGTPPTHILDSSEREVKRPASRARWQTGERQLFPADVPALLVIARGTRDPRGATEMDVLLDALRARHPAPVAAAWLEDFADPHVGDAVDRLAGRACAASSASRCSTSRAGHAKTDVPRELATARAAHPG